MNWITNSEEETIKVGIKYAQTLKGAGSKHSIGLIGGLGMGKTHFTKGIAQGLGYKETVTSPTFSIVQEYLTTNFPIFHFDFYRVENESDILSIGWEDYLHENGIIIVEWADRFPSLFPNNTNWFQFNETQKGRTIGLLEN